MKLQDRHGKPWLFCGDHMKTKLTGTKLPDEAETKLPCELRVQCGSIQDLWNVARATRGAAVFYNTLITLNIETETYSFSLRPSPPLYFLPITLPKKERENGQKRKNNFNYSSFYKRRNIPYVYQTIAILAY